MFLDGWNDAGDNKGRKRRAWARTHIFAQHFGEPVLMSRLRLYKVPSKINTPHFTPHTLRASAKEEGRRRYAEGLSARQDLYL